MGIINDLLKLKKNDPQLTSISLDYQMIDKTRFTELCEALKTNQYLQHLGLSGCKLSNDQIKQLSEALLVNSSLKILDISNNEMTDAGAAVFATMIRKNRGLISLNLTYHKITKVGAEPINSAIVANHILTEVRFCRDPYDLKTNFLSKEAEATLSRNKKVRDIAALGDVQPPQTSAGKDELMTNSSLKRGAVGGNGLFTCSNYREINSTINHNGTSDRSSSSSSASSFSSPSANTDNNN